MAVSISISIDPGSAVDISTARAWLQVLEQATVPPSVHVEAPESVSERLSPAPQATTQGNSGKTAESAPTIDLDSARVKMVALARDLVAAPDGAETLRGILGQVSAPRLSAVPDDAIQAVTSQIEGALS